MGAALPARLVGFMRSACARRQPTATSSQGRSRQSGSSGNARVPSVEDLSDMWLLAVQEEDAAAAGYCARVCESLRGAEAFAASDGLDAFISVAMGQSLKSGSGGLMVALAQALTMDMSPFKEAVFETLCAAGQWPSLKGRIAGSGVLGVVTAMLLSPRHPATVKALMVRLCGLLAADSLEAISLGDARRAEEFAKLRGQLISSGAVKAIVALAATEGVAAAAAATAIVQLACAGDETIRTELQEAKAVPHLLRSVQRLVQANAEPTDGSDEDMDVDGSPEAAASALSRLLAFEGDGCQELLTPVLEVEALKGFCDVLHAKGVDRQAVEQVVRCLELAGTRHSAWPPLEPEVCEDLRKMLVFRSGAAAAYLQALASHYGVKPTLRCFGDPKSLQRALEPLSALAPAAALLESLAGIQACGQCGSIPQSLMACSRCGQVAYCSRECQRQHWKLHKQACSQK